MRQVSKEGHTHSPQKGNRGHAQAKKDIAGTSRNFVYHAHLLLASHPNRYLADEVVALI